MRVKTTDRRDLKPGEMPPTPTADLILYHWSPKKNRKQIERYGLRIGMPSLQGDWRPPYVCFSDDPILAWYLSGRMWVDPKNPEEWDLWSVNMRCQTSFGHYEIILDTFPDTGRHYTKEYRVYSRVYKRDLTYVGTRSQ